MADDAVRVDVDDTLYGMAEVSRGFLHLERQRTKFLVIAIVVALLMNVGWLAVAVLRDRTRSKTIKNLSASISDLSERNEVLRQTQETLSQTVQDAVEQKRLLEAIRQLLVEFRDENRRSLDCVALYVSGNPSKSPDCVDVNKRIKALESGMRVFSTTTTTTRPRPTPTTIPPPPTTRAPAPTTTTTTPCSLSLLGLCIGGK